MRGTKDGEYYTSIHTRYGREVGGGEGTIMFLYLASMPRMQYRAQRVCSLGTAFTEYTTHINKKLSFAGLSRLSRELHVSQARGLCAWRPAWRILAH